MIGGRLGLVTLVLFGGAMGCATALPGPTASDLPHPDHTGPLAIVARDAGLEALERGQIEFTDDCVYLKTRFRRYLLVWPGTRVTWNAESGAARLLNPTKPAAVIANGDLVATSGGGDLSAEGGLPGNEWLYSEEWIAAPSPECDLSARWYVYEAWSE